MEKANRRIHLLDVEANAEDPPIETGQTDSGKHQGNNL